MNIRRILKEELSAINETNRDKDAILNIIKKLMENITLLKKVAPHSSRKAMIINNKCVEQITSVCADLKESLKTYK